MFITCDYDGTVTAHMTDVRPIQNTTTGQWKSNRYTYKLYNTQKNYLYSGGRFFVLEHFHDNIRKIEEFKFQLSMMHGKLIDCRGFNFREQEIEELFHNKSYVV